MVWGEDGKDGRVTHRLDSKVFLIVDDDPAQVALIGKILRMIGVVKLATANNGEEALERFQTGRVDMVISDLLMDGMDGFELARRIRRLPMAYVREIPIIVSTGYSTLVNVEAARDAGVTEVMRKPYLPIDLFHRVLAVLDQPREFVYQNSFQGPDRRRREDAPPRVERRTREIHISSTGGLIAT